MGKCILFALLIIVLIPGVVVTPAAACVPGIEEVTQYTWGPTQPVSICVLPAGAGQHQAFVYPGIPVTVELRFPLLALDQTPLPDVPLSTIIMLVAGGPPAVCDDALAGFLSGADGWVTFPFTGGGHRDPDIDQHLDVYLNLCPTQRLDVTEVVSFNSPDINGDLEVDLIDVVLFARDLGGGYDYRSDFNWNGEVDLGDLVTLAQAMGNGCP